MRRVAVLTTPVEEVRRIILYETEGGVSLFLSDSVEDAGSFADQWYASVDEAEQVAREQFGVKGSDWRDCPDPLPGCQHDWIAPVRVPGRDTDHPVWGTLERLEDGVWRPLPVRKRRG